MIRVCPCELPRSCTSGNCSRARTDRPRRASSNAAAEPMPPAPITMTSKAACDMMRGIVTKESRNSLSPPPLQLRRHPEVELPSLQIHAHNLHPHFIAQPITVPVAPALEQMPVRVELIVIVGEAADVHEPFGRKLLALREEAVFRHA